MIGSSTSSALMVTELARSADLYDESADVLLLRVPRLIDSSISSALMMIELFCPSSLQVMRLLSCQETSQKYALEVL
ncbi:uncharacterized protein BDCG_07496 [Blastomyces dermatitidis ER-3]|uniref:Uncharacterized protein n=1 Tax=Ajellomyces dermatitidis (strain ER-3 / ATCC MYA-2586) TaxID=559297 RepID=A0ABM9YIQ5_AJEDR|nr:uncharacterized protein BDCG_07496 [Blastomyces dermatitidis ER-3]EEQ92376.2 hypothetical protein BDCG_07496 [Blastomyces dermatitidis ER-3]